jgi:protein involved in polysaccharide export with SLBB domain
VIVTEGEPIYITGAVVSPHEMTLKDGLTLGRAIMMSGG